MTETFESPQGQQVYKQTYTVTTTPEGHKALQNMFQVAELACDIGSGVETTLFFDGDGSGEIYVDEVPDPDIKLDHVLSHFADSQLFICDEGISGRMPDDNLTHIRYNGGKVYLNRSQEEYTGDFKEFYA